jgi:pseudaminic acid cytidylyltransferase
VEGQGQAKGRMNIAIITARGGSKRIPRKNIRDFCGRPIISYSIETAITSGLFQEVMVSTDDEEIAEIAKRYGASVPFMRSLETANDYATTSDVLVEVLTNYKQMGRNFDYGCCIYPTALLLTVSTLKQAWDILQNDSTIHSVFPIIQFPSAIQRALRRNTDGIVSMFNPEYMNTRTQDLEKAYYDAGQFYWFHVNTFMENKRIYGDKSYGLIIDEMDAQDIDNESDWKIAEFKYQYRLLQTKQMEEV